MPRIGPVGSLAGVPFADIEIICRSERNDITFIAVVKTIVLNASCQTETDWKARERVRDEM